MRAKDRPEAQRLESALEEFHRNQQSLPGIQSEASRQALIQQIVESIRRVKYVRVVAQRDISPLRADPTSDLFDPIKAALIHNREGRTDEAFWLVFLSVHFGRNRRSGWRLVRDVYGRLGERTWSDWARTSADPGEFRRWLGANQAALRSSGGVHRAFGNHRKYESLCATSPRGTGAAVETYVAWVGAENGHSALIENAHQRGEGDSRRMFDVLYRSMGVVARFGRTARFDYLTMVGKVGLARIEPGSTYLDGATGPFDGAKLLFGNRPRMTREGFDTELVRLGDHLGIGMQVVEDALCNWQKSPDAFRAFRG